MSAERVRSVTEHDDHFAVDDGGARPFRVAKRGLSPALQEKIRGMCGGGEVPGYADGGEVDDDPAMRRFLDAHPGAAPIDSADDDPAMQRFLAAHPGAAPDGGLPIPAAPMGPMGPPAPDPGGPRDYPVDTRRPAPGSHIGDSLDEALATYAPAPRRPVAPLYVTDAQGHPQPFDPIAATAAANPPRAPVSPEDVLAAGGGGEIPVSVDVGPMSVETPPSVAPASPPSAMPSLATIGPAVAGASGLEELRPAVAMAARMAPGDDGSPDDINLTGVPKGTLREYEPLAARMRPVAEAMPLPATPSPGAGIPSVGMPHVQPGEVPQGLEEGLAWQRVGLQGRADAESRRADAEAQLYAQHEQERAALAARYEAKQEALQARADALRDEIAQAKVDPNRLWSHASTGQKVTSTIALFLGGLGASLARGPNYALEQFDKAIDRDVESQRADLGKKQSMLSDYLQQGHDLSTARQLAVADMKDAFAGKLQRAAAQTGSDLAIAAAQQALGQLMAQATQIRADAIGKDFQQKNAGLVLQQEMQLRALQGAHLKQQMQLGAQAKQQTQTQQMVEAAAAQGKEIPREFLPLLSHDTRKTLVQLPSGRFVAAADEESAKRVREATAAGAEMQGFVQRMAEMRREFKGGRLLPDAAAAAGESLREMAKVAYNHANGLGALDKGSEKLLDTIIADPMAFFATDAKVEAKLEELARATQRRVQSVQNANLLAPPTVALTPRRPGA